MKQIFNDKLFLTLCTSIVVLLFAWPALAGVPYGLAMLYLYVQYLKLWDAYEEARTVKDRTYKNDYRYIFYVLRYTEYESVLKVYLNGSPIAELPLYPQIWNGFTLSKMKEWLGEENTRSIYNGGQAVVLEREKPLSYDFSQHQK